MPPVSEPVLSAENIGYRGYPANNYHAVLHLCTNAKCTGSTVAYYVYQQSKGKHEYRFHRPEYHAPTVPEAVPSRPRTLLQDANDAIGAPTACAQAAVKAVEAMLAAKKIVKSKGVKGRIKEAVNKGILPQIMADWAEEIRVIANAAHTDVAEDANPLPDKAEATRALMFANKLAEYLFILPSEIAEARKKKSPKK